MILIHIIIYALERFLGIGMLAWIFDFGLLILWLIAIFGAIQGEEKRVPLLGDQFQEWFKSIG